MDFPTEYFEDEVRDGFYVPSMIKHAWAAQIEVLKEVTEICDRHGIRFFADWGTMLGAVRHGGFIPWDDDLDVLMLRKDYEAFLKIARDELPERYQINNIYSHDDFDNLLTRINNTRFVCDEPEFMEHYHHFPCSVGMDVFVIDYLPRDPEMRRQLSETITLLTGLKFQIEDVPDEEKDSYIEPIEDALGVKIDRDKPLMKQFSLLVEKVASMYTEEESDHLTCMTLWSEYSGFMYPKDAFRQQVRIPFENYEIPVPVGYDRLLRRKYGNYMHQVRDHESHNYPYFKKQYDEFMEATNKPKFVPFKPELPRGYTGVTENSKKEREDFSDSSVKLSSAKKGFLEAKCEEIMQLMQQVEDALNDAAAKGDTCAKSELEAYAAQLSAEANNLIDRLEGKMSVEVFLPVKYEWWPGLESIWRQSAESEDKMVLTIPLPFYDRDVMGQFRAGYHDIKRFPKEVGALNYEEINLADIHPDKIYIQVPFDKYNDGFMTQPEYFTDKLREACEELIYVPYFVMDDVGPEDRRALMHMHCYVDTPGVFNADITYVQSEKMKEAYVNELCSFAGEEYRTIWQQKLMATTLPIATVNPMEKYLKDLPADYNAFKHLCFHMGLATIIEMGDASMTKLSNVIDTFASHKDKIRVTWIQEKDFEEKLFEYAPQLVEEYRFLKKCFDEDDMGEIKVLTDRKEIIALMDAYYGDAGFMPDLFAQAGKPVMIMDPGT